MENSVLGNALEGVPQEEEGEGDEGEAKPKPKVSNVEGTENIDGGKFFFLMKSTSLFFFSFLTE